MVYVLILGPDCWYSNESRSPINIKNNGLKYIEELLRKPGQMITAVRLFYTLLPISEFDSPDRVFECHCMSARDYITRCYNEAKDEQLEGRKLLSLYEEYRNKLCEKKRQASFTEAEIYQSKLDEVRKIIFEATKLESNLDAFINKANHKVYCDVNRTIASLESQCPILQEYFAKTITAKFNLIYEPCKAPDFELIIRETTEPPSFIE